MVKNNHIYTVYYDLNSFSKRAEVAEFDFNVSQNYSISDKEEPVKYKSFDNVDELLKLTDEDEKILIHVENNMAKVLHQLKSARYEPYLKYEVGMISETRVRFKYKHLRKSVHYRVVAQNLSKQTVYEVIAKSEEV